jgi:hypothetical protein
MVAQEFFTTFVLVKREGGPAKYIIRIYGHNLIYSGPYPVIQIFSQNYLGAYYKF